MVRLCFAALTMTGVLPFLVDEPLTRSVGNLNGLNEWQTAHRAGVHPIS